MADESDNQPSAATLGYLAPICVAIFFIFVWIIVGTRHRFARNQDGQHPIDPESWPLGYGHFVLASDQIESQFPLMKYTDWCANTEAQTQTHPNNLCVKESNGAGFGPNSDPQPSEPTSPLSSTPSLDRHVEDKEGSVQHVEGDSKNSEAAGTGMPASINGDSHLLCAICMEYFNGDDSIRSLTCGHIFHAACLDPWFTKRQARCPLCKKSYRPERSGPYGITIGNTPSPPGPVRPPAALIRTQVLPRLL